MKSIKKINHLFPAAILFLLLLSSCAQVVAPGGGDRDATPPKVLSYSPDSAQLNFHAKYIVLDFDEYIQLKDLNNQLIISPPFENNPDVKVKNKSLTIDLSKQELLPNTTYSINFGNAVQDINENNAIENFKYIFSTGSYIDSLSIKGKVQTAFDHKTEKGLLVMLYSDANDSSIYNEQPDYFGKTIADGTFEINNIRPGKYKIFALKDVNSDFKYSGDAENIGFIEGTVEPSAKVDSTEKEKKILIETFRENPKKVYVKKYLHSSYGKIMLFFSQGSDSIAVKNMAADVLPQNEIFNYSKNKDTLTYWIRNYEKDSLKLQISNGSTVIDTIGFKMIKKEDALKSKRNPLKLSVISSPGGNQTFDINGRLILNFSNPIDSTFYTQPIPLLEDSLLTKENKYLQYLPHITKVEIAAWDSTDTKEDPNNPGTFITAPFRSSPHLKESTNYHLLILPGTFTDIFGLTNDSIKIDFKTREQKYYGSLKLNVNVPATKGKYIVQIMDEKETIIREELISKAEILTFEYLPPNKYRIKLIYDENGNGKWDSGNYLQKVQPEKVIYNEELVTIRSNWDADIEWKIKGTDN